MADFEIPDYPCASAPRAAIANAEFAVLASYALAGRITALNVQIDDETGLVFDTATSSAEAKALDSIEQSIQNATIKGLPIPTSAIKRASDKFLKETHAHALECILVDFDN